ncbi:hypothetical protein FIBSPDRAFT_946130 [Athelia psychrophila]|uniref:Uncharacterized protein n=1 Tax=Athelia psychrophila TaxID=1759441 RepID=A0A166TAW8_9AGAM|nr:hypothetical protein FIBSPDRAFT_946130 [Fibularhizoctonia sp. CBS 109695]
MRCVPYERERELKIPLLGEELPQPQLLKIRLPRRETHIKRVEETLSGPPLAPVGAVRGAVEVVREGERHLEVARQLGVAVRRGRELVRVRAREALRAGDAAGHVVAGRVAAPDAQQARLELRVARDALPHHLAAVRLQAPVRHGLQVRELRPKPLLLGPHPRPPQQLETVRP